VRQGVKRGAKKTAKTAKKASTGTKTYSRLNPEMKLKLVKENPFREGSVRFKAAELAGKSGTVDKYLKSKGPLNYLSWLVRKDFVKAS
jgi:hypothetical protein